MIKNKIKETRRIKKSEVIKDFKTVEWTRKIRDKMYKDNMKSDIHTYIKKILS
jgi:hypothetical protein